MIGRDDAEVARAIAGQRGTFADLPGDLASWTAAGFVGGTPDRVVAQLGAFVGAGAARFTLQHNDLDDRRSLELLAAEVAPSCGEPPDTGSAMRSGTRCRFPASRGRDHRGDCRHVR